MTPTSTIGQSLARRLVRGAEAVYLAYRQTLASIGGTSNLSALSIPACPVR
ncbi:hypothetical protein [Cohnella kolymensis]|uniref:hypothetical protein n=1 Tax=Cohnella kolymensis TaxID=1590652 RepID=UPI000B0CFC59|nr:hypothetical protein [Cohnella kolymensis]